MAAIATTVRTCCPGRGAELHLELLLEGDDTLARHELLGIVPHCPRCGAAVPAARNPGHGR